MIRLRGGSSIAVFLAAAALALGACGGDDKGNGDTTDTGAALDTTVNSGTGTTGTTEKQTTGTTREDRTTTRERGDDKGGRKRSGSGRSGGSDGGSGDSGSGTQPGNVRKVAQTVCNGFLPKVIARDLEKGKRKPEDVARDYSRGFPKNQQQLAYEGCLAGLKARG
jgi:hypothetical protein